MAQLTLKSDSLCYRNAPVLIVNPILDARKFSLQLFTN